MSMNIAETFGPVIQGEGITAGHPCFFIRMSTCNLMCGGHNGKLMKEGKATWWCDTEVIWKKGTPWEPQQILDFMDERGELENILAGSTHVILSGGEPTIPINQKAIVEFANYVKEKYPDSTPFYEIETNGTRITHGFMENYIQQVNCSPKLANSGMPKAMRIVPKAIEEINNHPNGWFKIVVTDENDWAEIEEDYLPLIDRNKLILMPGGTTTEELKPSFQAVWNLATKHNVKACGRYQVWAWEQTVGV